VRDNIASISDLEEAHMHDLIPLAEKIAVMLKQRRENVAVAESSTGGLISAALLSVPGASAYFIGGAVVYTLKARRAMLDVPDSAFAGIKSVTEEGAMILARAARTRFAVTWSIAEIGASGPTGNRYGDAAGHSCIAVAGPGERSANCENGSSEHVANMRTFSAAALNLLIECMS
jgi:nicotinamide-nucleotide amidase